MGKSSRKKKVHALRDGPLPSAEMNSPELAQPFNWKHVLVIFVICVAAYSNTIGMKFVWDDFCSDKRKPAYQEPVVYPFVFHLPGVGRDQGRIHPRQWAYKILKNLRQKDPCISGYEEAAELTISSLNLLK
jgi:hypothetical protein